MTGAATKQILDPSRRNPTLDPLLAVLARRLVGQPEAAKVLVDVVATHLSGLGCTGRPVGTALFLGPTGTGKTLAVETLCQGLLGDTRACVKIDCAEFQHSHEIAKLIGSPPGYLGHRETPPLLTQKALDQWNTPGLKLNVVLFDEIEKASDSVWQLMLGIMDKATLTLGDNSRTDFSNSIVVLTSNLGAKKLHERGFGFRSTDEVVEIDDTRMSTVAKEAAKKHFTPEFMNRIDHIVVFKTLTKVQIEQIMMIELGLIQKVMLDKAKFVYQLTPAAKHRILEEGYSVEYGARNLKRTIERLVRLPLAALVSSGQITPGSAVVVDQVGKEDFEFSIQELSQTEVKFTDFMES